MMVSNLLALDIFAPVVGPIVVWQIPVILILIVLIVFWLQYRKKQM
jgi:hypothetical protein